MEFVVNGIRLSVDVHGSGSPAVVFLHYWGGSSRTWKGVAGALKGNRQVVAPDLRGWGQSDPTAEHYALRDYAADIEGLVASLGLREYVLVGHSLGGKIAQLIASRRPQGLAGLVLVAPSPAEPLDLPEEALKAMEGAYTSQASVEGTIDFMLTHKPLTAAQRAQVIEDSLRGAPQAKAAWPRGTRCENIAEAVKSINVPTLVIAGEYDKVDSVDILRTHLLPYIAHARLHVVPETGHLSPLESPTEIAALIDDFVDALAPHRVASPSSY
jgi:pimeloyl-ACP methyl ester carboxylesterase